METLPTEHPHCRDRTLVACVTTLNVTRYTKGLKNIIFIFQFQVCLSSVTMKSSIIFSVLTLVTVVQSQSCPREDSIMRPGDVMIGGLFKIHDSTEDGSTCTNMTDGAAIQRVEAFLYAIERINKQNLVPGVKFGENLKVP